MRLHPYVAAKIADERRRDLIAEANAERLSRAARECRPTAPQPTRQGLSRIRAARLPSWLASFTGPRAYV